VPDDWCDGDYYNPLLLQQTCLSNLHDTVLQQPEYTTWMVHFSDTKPLDNSMCELSLGNLAAKMNSLLLQDNKYAALYI
jgi:hypothetical protein